MPRNKKSAAAPAIKPAGGGSPGELPAASAEALAIDQAAAVSHAEISGTAQPGPAAAPAAPDLGAEIGQRDQEQAAQLSAQEIAQVQARGTAQLLMMLGTKVAARRWPGITFDQDETHQGVDVLAPVLIKYDLGSALFDRWKEEFAAGAFFAGLITAKVEQYEAAQRKRQEEKKTEPAAGEAAHGG